MSVFEAVTGLFRAPTPSRQPRNMVPRGKVKMLKLGSKKKLISNI
jgi:hypothetical protein